VQGLIPEFFNLFNALTMNVGISHALRSRGTPKTVVAVIVLKN
jgi:hypothetical protein